MECTTTEVLCYIKRSTSVQAPFHHHRLQASHHTSFLLVTMRAIQSGLQEAVNHKSREARLFATGIKWSMFSLNSWLRDQGELQATKILNQHIFSCWGGVSTFLSFEPCKSTQKLQTEMIKQSIQWSRILIPVTNTSIWIPCQSESDLNLNQQWQGCTKGGPIQVFPLATSDWVCGNFSSSGWDL